MRRKATQRDELHVLVRAVLRDKATVRCVALTSDGGKEHGNINHQCHSADVLHTTPVLGPRETAGAEIQVLLVTASAAMVQSMLRLRHEASFITSSSHGIGTPQENLGAVHCYARLYQGN
jgi:hypothetical protein